MGDRRRFVTILSMGWVVLLAFGVACRERDAARAGAAGTGMMSSSDGDSLPRCNAPDQAYTWPMPEVVTVPSDPSWKSHIEILGDGFFSPPEGEYPDALVWMKFIVLARDPEHIYFQNANTQPFHYDFATTTIPPFQGLSRAEFNSLSLESSGRQAILGAVVVPLDRSRHSDYGVQIVSNDDVHPELVEKVLETVAAHVAAPAGTTQVYLPMGSAAECLDVNRTDLATRGILAGSIDDWLLGDACYSPGWAVGKLVQLAAADVDRAYLEGRLGPDDILLVRDSAPADIPYVAGILTLEPSTPNSHAAILAGSYGVPFAYVRESDGMATAMSLVDKRVAITTAPVRGIDPFRVDVAGTCRVRFIDLSELGNGQLDEIRSLATPPRLEVQPKEAAGTLVLSADGLVPSDIRRVGGKAAHFGVLRATIPNATPAPAIALTFDLWDAFLDATPPGSDTALREVIAARLASVPWPPDLPRLDAALADIRGMIRAVPFPPALRDHLMDALAPFDPMTRIRFRSSTNVEDSETFTGAGLYDSATGCLADDLDADDEGPSHCNADEREEHGVFRAIARVYSSFYFRNAYLERLRRGVDESTVGMGVLVHYSAPDALELANGVGTLHFGLGVHMVHLVSQTGATSVTNPEGRALPEDVWISASGELVTASSGATIVRRSTLLPIGARVLQETDYADLATSFVRVAQQYAQLTGKEPPFSLDFEYKKVAPGALSVRQVRPLTASDAAEDVTLFYVGSPKTFCVYPGDYADAFALHRLKTHLQLTGASSALTSEALGIRLYDRVRFEYSSNGAALAIDEAEAAFSGRGHTVELDGLHTVVFDSWTTSSATWTLSSRVPTTIRRRDNPVLTTEDFRLYLEVRWASPVPFVGREDSAFVVMSRTDETVSLWGRCPDEIQIGNDFVHVEKTYSQGGITIETAFWYPPGPLGPTGGYTAPLVKWDRTIIHGITTKPIVLTGYYSQTHAPQHHNFGGQYIFEPRLEVGIQESTLAALTAANITYVAVVDDGNGESSLWAAGLDGALRPL